MITEKELEKTKFIVLENFGNDSLEIKIHKGKKMSQSDWRLYNIALCWATGITFVIGLLLGLLIRGLL